MPNPNDAQYPMPESAFSRPEVVARRGRVGRRLAVLALGVVGVATFGGALMSGHTAGETVSHDLRAPVAAAGYESPRVSSALMAPLVGAAGRENPAPMDNPPEPQPGAAYLDLIQEGHTSDGEAQTVIEDTPAAGISWQPDNRTSHDPAPLRGSVVYD